MPELTPRILPSHGALTRARRGLAGRTAHSTQRSRPVASRAVDAALRELVLAEPLLAPAAAAAPAAVATRVATPAGAAAPVLRRWSILTSAPGPGAIVRQPA